MRGLGKPLSARIAIALFLALFPAAGLAQLPDLDLPGLGGAAPPPAESLVTVQGVFSRPDAQGRAELTVEAMMAPGWHIYSITQPAGGPVRTKIQLTPSPQYEVGQFQAATPPEKKAEAAFGGLTVESHYGKAVWRAPLKLGAGVDPANLKLEGRLTAQPCDPNSCLPPRPFAFQARLVGGVAPSTVTTDQKTPPGLALTPRQPLAAESSAASASDLQTAAGPGGASRHAVAGPAPTGNRPAFEVDKIEVVDREQIRDTSLLVALALGFLGGLILNVMPCVLPVIGLKIFAFMQQAGQSRREAFLLNVWYSAGLMSVFLVLAGLAVALGWGWGQLFSMAGFSITMAAVVFAMGLSFLGVWEIPIPGFVGRGKANELADREGAGGAFAKGVLTTLLATPCSGPGVAYALTWTVTQPPAYTFAVFAAMGLGMASPYLLIGAFPGLLRFLPKPGAWMETFQQLMGFVLLGTVVFILTFIPSRQVVPTVALLFGIWLACWWIGRTSLAADLQARLRAWLTAAAITGVVWLGAFGGFFEKSVTLPWQPFTRTAFEDHVQSRKTVLVDFTADWCLTCKTLERFVLNTPEVKDAVESNGVVTLKADWTHGDKEVTEMLEKLGAKQVPVLAIFPAGSPNTPISLPGNYGVRTVIEAIEKATAMKTASL